MKMNSSVISQNTKPSMPKGSPTQTLATENLPSGPGTGAAQGGPAGMATDKITLRSSSAVTPQEGPAGLSGQFDGGMAAQASAKVKEQILSMAQQAVSTQANQEPHKALSLLQ